MMRPSQDAKFGDYQANFAMPLGKRLGGRRARWPRRSSARLEVDDLCEPPKIAGPGFINLRLKNAWLVAGRSQRALADERLGVAPVERAAHVCHRLLGAERGQADARRPHPLDRDRRRSSARCGSSATG